MLLVTNLQEEVGAEPGRELENAVGESWGLPSRD